MDERGALRLADRNPADAAEIHGSDGKSADPARVEELVVEGAASEAGTAPATVSAPAYDATNLTDYGEAVMHRMATRPPQTAAWNAERYDATDPLEYQKPGDQQRVATSGDFDLVQSLARNALGGDPRGGCAEIVRRVAQGKELKS